MLLALVLGQNAPALPNPGSLLATTTVLQSSNPNRLYQLKELQTATLKFGGKSIKAWIMDTNSKRQEGMMFLTDKEVPKDHGMIFVFSEEQPLSFWMRNTILPLDLAYINSIGKVVSVHQLKPYDETGVPSAAPAKYVLEMKRGAFSRLGIKKGTQFSIPGSVRAKN